MSTMILGLSTSTFTTIHVLLSLVGIASGLVVLYGLIRGKSFNRGTLLFLSTTVATSVTGFLFPNEHLTPGIKIGILSILILALAIVAKYTLALAGRWRKVFTISSVVALYFNCFVGVVQAFEKIPALHAVAPQGKEPPFAIAQLILLVAFLVLGTLATRRFRAELVQVRRTAA
jgi:hypothetical protein